MTPLYLTISLLVAAGTGIAGGPVAAPAHAGDTATRTAWLEGHMQAALDDPDALYAGRDDLSKARRAVDLWTARLAEAPSDFEVAWKLSQGLYWLGLHDTPDLRRGHLERGIEIARRAIALRENRPEGHFWMAAHMGALAESFGLRQGLRYRKPIREALERVLALDPAYLGGAADRALGRWYFRVPRLFGGSNDRAVEHLQKSFVYNPNSTIGHYFLAETLLDMGAIAEARAELQKVIEAPVDPEWAPEDREWKARARTLLGKVR